MKNEGTGFLPEEAGGTRSEGLSPSPKTLFVPEIFQETEKENRNNNLFLKQWPDIPPPQKKN